MEYLDVTGALQHCANLVITHMVTFLPLPPPPLLRQRKVQSEYSSLSKGETEDVGLVGQVVEDLITMEGTIFKVRREGVCEG